MSQAEEINIKQAATDALVPDVKPNVATTLSDDVPRVDYVEEPCLYKQHAHPDINAVVPNTTNDPATCPINTASVDSTIFTANIMLDHVSNMNADGAGKQKKKLILTRLNLPRNTHRTTSKTNKDPKHCRVTLVLLK